MQLFTVYCYITVMSFMSSLGILKQNLWGFIGVELLFEASLEVSLR
jgi:hypothetical protein